MAANATFALNAGVWFRRARLLIVSPDSSGTACPLSGRNSTYPPVQISAPSSGCRSNLWIGRSDGEQRRMWKVLGRFRTITVTVTALDHDGQDAERWRAM